MKEFLIKFKEDQSGQSLIEILIALTIGAILISAASIAVVTVLQSGTASERSQTAAVLAQDYMEKARTIAGSDWHSLDNLTKSSSTLYHFGISTSSAVRVLEGEEGIISDDIRENLVGYWGLDEASSTTAYDKSGNNNDGTINGATATSTKCKVGRCFSFNGTSDHILIGDPSGGELDFGTGDFTLFTWFKVENLPSTWKSIINKGGSGAVGYGMEINSSNRVTCSINSSGGSNQHVYGSTPSTGDWHNLICVFDRDDQIYVYLDGQVVATSTYAAGNTNSVSNSAGFNIGRYHSGSWYFDGSVDDVRVYNRALSVTEIDNMHNSSFFDRSFYVEDICRTNDSNYEIAGVKPCDSGEVEDPSTVKITVQVSWGSDGEFIVEDYITRWRNKTFPQTDWSGGSGFDGPFTTPTNRYSTSTNISTSTGGIQVEGI